MDMHIYIALLLQTLVERFDICEKYHSTISWNISLSNRFVFFIIIIITHTLILWTTVTQDYLRTRSKCLHFFGRKIWKWNANALKCGNIN